MRILILILIIVLVVAGTWFLSQRKESPAERTARGPFEKIQSGEAVLIDVRTLEEYAAGHAKGAILFDSRRVEQGEIPDVPKDKEIFLYCRSGNRAGVVRPILERKGFTRVTSLGGLPDMEALGAEMVK